MDYSKLSQAEFVEKLGKLSVKELHKLALGYGIDLPLELKAKPAVLQAMYDALTSAPAAAVEPSLLGAPSSPQAPAAAGRRIRFASTTGHRYFCGTWRLYPEWTDWYPVNKIPSAELRQLRNDKHVAVQEA